MARITVEDCLEKNQEPIRFSYFWQKKEQHNLMSGDASSWFLRDNDKNTVISLREIGEGKVSIKTLEESAINKLAKTTEM